MKEKIKLSDFDIVLMDLDGTVYYGSKLINGANEAIKFFRDNKKQIFFTTNNSTKTRRQIYEKLCSIGVDCDYSEIITSGYLAALYCKSHSLNSIYIFGSKNLISEFNDVGVSVTENETAQNLLIGYNPDMTYEGLTEALQVALHAKCIIACNRERVFLGEGARSMPGCGAMTAPIEWCANRECDIVIGKPNTMMVDLISGKTGTPNDRFLVVGDTYESDIRMADRAGAKSIYVESYISRLDFNLYDSVKREIIK